MAACFQVILTWSSLTTAKLFPLFSPPSLPPSFFRSGLLKDRERAQTKTMAGSYGAFRSKSGQVFKFRIDRLWKAVWKGEGWRRVKGGGQGFARVHPGGYVFSRLCDVSAGGGRNQKFRDTRCRRSHVSFVATTLPPSPFNVESLLSGEHVLPGNLPDVWIHCDSQSRSRFREDTFKNRL